MAAPQEDSGIQFKVRDSKTGEDVKLAMEELWLTGKVLPVGARLVLRHVFKSAEIKPLELVYTYGLPRDATLRSFRVVGEGFTVESELKLTEKAREEYEEGIAQGHLAVLNRVYNDGLASLSVGNVRPGETVAVYLEILAGVEHHDDGFRFRFPFTLAPSYHRKARVAVTPEGYGEMELPEDRYDDLLLPPWSSDAQNLHTVGFDLLVEFPGRGAQVASPSHLLAARMGDEDSAYVQLANMDDLPNRDLVLDVKMEASEPKVFAGIDKDSQTQFIGVVPSTAFGKRPDTPMRVAFVVDRSGSMGGAPMEQAKKAIRACLGALRPEDQFGIVAFDDRTSVFAADLVPGTRENREKAAEFLSRVDARGGTELLEGLSAATRLFGEPGGDIFLLTDGEVFAGSEIMAGMHDRGFRIHCLGIGSASQDRFLALLARETGGVSRFMTPRERVDLAALELFASVGRPVATGVGCIVAGSTDARLSPAPADTVFAGTPLVVYGSCPADAECVLQLKFEGADGSGTLEYPIAAAPSDLAETLRLLRGARLITDLESQLSQAGTESGPKGKRSANRVRELLKKASQEYGLASQVMSLVAVVKREGDVEGELPKITVIPVGMPQDTDFAGYFAYSAPPASFDTLEWSGTVRLCRMATYSVRDVSSPPDLGIADLRAPASHESHARLASEDRLVELAALLEPDGGMPGDDLEERILASLLALLAFYGEGHDFNRGPFARHMERLATWLEQADRSMLSDEHRDIITRVLDAIDAKRAVHGFGAEIANKFILEDEMDAPAAWASLRKAFDQSAYGEL